MITKQTHNVICEQPFTITISTITAQTNNEKERGKELERESAITTKTTTVRERGKEAERERERGESGNFPASTTPRTRTSARVGMP